MDMDTSLLIVVALQFFYIVYSDIQNRKERESLQMKLMSKDLTDYKSNLEETPKDSPKEVDPYVAMEDIGIEQLLKTKEKR
jgi:hypothetical protein